MSNVNASSGKLSKEVVNVPHIDSTSAKKAVRIFLITSLLLSTLQLALNWTLNPTGELREDGVLLPSIRNSDPYQKLELLDDFLDEANGQPVGIVMGSSRSMMLSFEDSRNGERIPFFNFGTSGALGEDIYAFSNYLASRPDANVTHVVIAVDFTTLGTPNDSGYGERIRGVYPIAEPIREEIPSSLTQEINSLLSLDWARAAVGMSQPESDLGFGQCGARSDEEYAGRVERSRETRDEYRQNHVSLVLRSLPESPHLDQRRVDGLEKAVELWLENGTLVTLLMTPFQADLLAGLQKEEIFVQRHEVTRDILVSLGNRDGVRFVDLTDPREASIESNEYWWDGYHYSSAAAAAMGDYLGFNSGDAALCAGMKG